MSFEARLKQAAAGDWVRYYVAGGQFAGWRGGRIERIGDQYLWLIPDLGKGSAQPVHFSHVSELQSGGQTYTRR